MLKELYIKNIAVIDKLEMTVNGGLNVLTGETGAGKSIIIDSVNLISGGRADKLLVRHGCDKAVVKAVFSAGSAVCARLEENDIETENGDIFMARTITTDGKTTAKINDVPVTVNFMREIADMLINIHGQHDSQALLTPLRHIEFIDSYAKNMHEREEYRRCYLHVRELEQELSKLMIDEQEKGRLTDLLKYQTKEIEKADLKIGEEEELKSRRDIFRNSEKINEAVETAYLMLYDSDDDNSAYDKISSAVSAMRTIEGINEKTDSVCASLSDILYSIEDAAHDIKEFAEGTAYDENMLNEVEGRLDLISNLKRKYGSTVEEILAFAQRASAQLGEIERSDERINEIETELAAARKELSDKAKRLTDTRRKAGEKLRRAVEEMLMFLDMEKTRFRVSIEKKEDFEENGADKVEFLISTNPGEPLKPLVKIASGGELSRIMLAIKSVLADADKVKTLIFDEIDTGVSGEAALRIARTLSELAKTKQIICITHLPQLTAAGDTHYLITKDVSGEKAKTSVRELGGEERVEELARITDGKNITETAKQHARELIAKAHKN